MTVGPEFVNERTFTVGAASGATDETHVSMIVVSGANTGRAIQPSSIVLLRRSLSHYTADREMQNPLAQWAEVADHTLGPGESIASR